MNYNDPQQGFPMDPAMFQSPSGGGAASAAAQIAAQKDATANPSLQIMSALAAALKQYKQQKMMDQIQAMLQAQYTPTDTSYSGMGGR